MKRDMDKIGELFFKIMLDQVKEKSQEKKMEKKKVHPKVLIVV